MNRIVVVGTGQAGMQLAASLREQGFAGQVTLVGEEPGLPYQRPPLSKAYLDGRADDVSLQLRPQAWFDEHRIQIVARQRATRIDRDRKELHLGSLGRLPYDHLVLATGARNRALPVPGADLDGVVQLRTLADAADLKARLASVRRLVVVGAGFIGLEVAAVAAARGLAVAVIEATGRPMARALSPAMSSFFREAHERAGIAFVFDAVVAAIVGRDGRAAGVALADGREIEAELILVGIGIVPNVDLAVEAQLAVTNGIAVDDHLLTSDPAISAIGDCASHPSRFAAGASIRIESVQNAVDQARAVAARLTGSPAPYGAVPWFWSDQSQLKLQMAGLGMPHETAVIRGDPASGAFSVFCFGGGRLIGVESVNRPADHMIGRRLLAAGTPISPEAAADPAFDLRGLAGRPG